VDNLDFKGSPDEARWNGWHNLQSAEDKLKKAS
jgi:phenol hydroxylase P3 protein